MSHLTSLSITFQFLVKPYHWGILEIGHPKQLAIQTWDCESDGLGPLLLTWSMVILNQLWFVRKLASPYLPYTKVSECEK